MVRNGSLSRAPFGDAGRSDGEVIQIGSNGHPNVCGEFWSDTSAPCGATQEPWDDRRSSRMARRDLDPRRSEHVISYFNVSPKLRRHLSGTVPSFTKKAASGKNSNSIVTGEPPKKKRSCCNMT